MTKFPGPIQPEWATYCESRSPKFKVHASKGHATGAVSDKRPDRAITLYHYNKETNDWEVVIDYTPPNNCEECGGTFEHESYGRVRISRNIFNYDTKLKQYELPVICESCYDTKCKEYAAERERQRELKQLAALKSKYER